MCMTNVIWTRPRWAYTRCYKVLVASYGQYCCSPWFGLRTVEDENGKHTLIAEDEPDITIRGNRRDLYGGAIHCVRRLDDAVKDLAWYKFLMPSKASQLYLYQVKGTRDGYIGYNDRDIAFKQVTLERRILHRGKDVITELRKLRYETGIKESR